MRRALGLHDAVFICFAGVVGSGIFLTPAAIAAHLPHAGLILLAWVVGGALSLTGAFANAELGAMFPRAGGNYVYLREAFHPAAGFLAGWLSFFAIFAGTVATLAVGFASALLSFFAWPPALLLPLAVLTILACSLLNWAGVRAGAIANNITGWVKFTALFAFVLLAPFFGGSLENLRPLVDGATRAAPALAFLLALSPVLFSYLGWNSVVYVASELRDPGRNLPRSLFIGLALCTALYLLLNGVYLLALPPAALAQTENAGEAAALVFFGETGGRVLAAFVLVSILGTLNATVLVGPRIAYAMALDGLLPRAAASVNAKSAAPAGAIWTQAAVAVALVLLLQNFPSALDYTTFAIVLATIADVGALYWLRKKRPRAHRPYRAFGYPLLPALYVIANGAIALALLIGATKEALGSVLVVLLGVPVYWLFTRRNTG